MPLFIFICPSYFNMDKYKGGRNRAPLRKQKLPVYINRPYQNPQTSQNRSKNLQNCPSCCIYTFQLFITFGNLIILSYICSVLLLSNWFVLCQHSIICMRSSLKNLLNVILSCLLVIKLENEGFLLGSACR